MYLFPKVIIVTGVANKELPVDLKQTGARGDLVEQNADAMEYSDEEKDRELEQAMSSLAARAKTLPVTDHNKVYYRCRGIFSVHVLYLTIILQL